MEWHGANKSFVVMLILICWSVDLQETFVIGIIYQAQDNTFKQKKFLICLSQWKSKRFLLELVEKMEVFMSYTCIITPDFSILKHLTYIDTIMHG